MLISYVLGLGFPSNLSLSTKLRSHGSCPRERLQSHLVGLPALERGGATTFCLRHLPQVCSALPCMSDCDPPCSTKTHALPRTCSRFVRHEPCTLSTCSRVRFMCVSAQVCIQGGFEDQFSTAGDAAASKHGFWLLMKVRPKICILHNKFIARPFSRFTCGMAQVCIQEAFDLLFSTVRGAPASRFGFWLLAQVRQEPVCQPSMHPPAPR